MFIQDFYLKEWDWDVRVYYAVDTFYMDNILYDLIQIGCSSTKVNKVYYELTRHPYNNGLTYSNVKYRCSIIVIGLTDSPEEFQNTFDHEKGHLAMHIAETDQLDVFGEEFQYLTGTIGQKMFPIAKRFMCEHCRKKL